MKDGQVWQDVAVVGVFVAGRDDDRLDCAGRIVAVVSFGDCSSQEGGRVGVDDDCGVGMFVVDCLADGPRVVVEGTGVLNDVAEMEGWRVNELLCGFDNGRSDERSACSIIGCLTIKVDHPDFELGKFAFGAILGAPED